jgi:peptidoglycan-N-acetylglucosamine deacetylase
MHHMIRTPFAVAAAILAAISPNTSKKAQPARAAEPVSPAPAAEVQPAPAPAVVAKAAPVSSGRVTFSQCNVDGPFIAMTFDDGPHGAQTPRLLKMLKERNIKATFFVVGQCVAQFPEIAKQIVEEGHEIANHSWSHPLLSKMAEGGVREQLQKTHDVVKQTTGVTMTLMRPPFGGFTKNQQSWAHGTWGYKCILWDVDSMDWKHRSPAKTESIIMDTTKSGSIVLCHDIHKTTVDAMEATMDGLVKKGFKFVTVSELIAMHKEGGAPVKPKTAATLKAGDVKEVATSIDEIAAPKVAR